MRVLWVCNLVLPEFSKVFEIKPTCYGGWMSGMLHQLEQVDGLVIGLCFPIIDEDRMKNSVHGCHPFYSFHASIDSGEYKVDTKVEFLHILKDFCPDLIHIWGTEYNHARAMMDACLQLGLGNKVLVHIQGLVSYCAMHYTLGVDSSFLTCGYPRSILDERRDFSKRGKVEKSILRSAVHVCDCSEWGKLSVELINPDINFYYCNDILRKSFYSRENIWSPQNCQRHTVFISQASYPVKGLHFLLQAVAIVKKRYKDVMLYIGGLNIMDSKNAKTGYAQYIKYIINKEKLFEHIKFLGLLDEIRMVNQYLNANIFVSSSTIENPSNSICEAMLLGTPVVASYVGGTPSLIRHGMDGFLYPCDAYYMLAHYIMKVFSDDELAKRISRTARNVALRRHDPEKIGRRMLEIYHTVASM